MSRRYTKYNVRNNQKINK